MVAADSVPKVANLPVMRMAAEAGADLLEREETAPARAGPAAVWLAQAVMAAIPVAAAVGEL